jgi:hypothetical protein
MAMPRAIIQNTIQAIAQNLAATSKEAARALPLSKGGETPLQLQTHRTEVYSYFTAADGETALLYSAENWVRIKLTLETAGPVSVGTAAELAPVLGGRGRLLDTSVEYEVYLARGTRFYVVADTINRLSVTIEPIPWLEQISQDVGAALANVAGTVGQVGAAIVRAIRGNIASAPKAPDLPCPPPSANLLPRLTSLRPPRLKR